MSKKTQLDSYESLEVADFITKTNNPDEDFGVSENALAEKYNISLDDFHEIINSVFQMIDFGLSPLTNEAFIGLSKGNEWICKKEITNQFIGSMIEWISEGDDLKKQKFGFVKEVSLNNESLCKILILKPKVKYTLSQD
jgi:hypothetical protein